MTGHPQKREKRPHLERARLPSQCLHKSLHVRIGFCHQILLRIGTQMGEAMLGTSVAARRSQEGHIITGRIRAPDRNLHASPQLEPEIVLIAKSLNRLLSIVGG